MSAKADAQLRVVPAVHGKRPSKADREFEAGFSRALLEEYGKAALIEIYARYAQGDGYLDSMMRRAIWRALAVRVGEGLSVGSGAGFKHLETLEIGDSVFVGAQACLQGRYDGHCVIGNHVWIGPQSFLDARDLELEDYVGWGPGARVLGSEHSGLPADMPIVQTDLLIKPVRVRAWADIGTNATILPGVTIGKGAIVGAGAVVVHDVPDFAVVAGVPARFLRWREGHAGGHERPGSS